MSSSRLLSAPNPEIAALLKSKEMSLGDLKSIDNQRPEGVGSEVMLKLGPLGGEL